MRAWVIGLELWHHINGAPWHGSSHLKRAAQGASVKNRFYDLTKEQEGRDWQGKDIMNDHQGKALREGCVKENGLGRVCLQERRITAKGT